MIKSLIVDDESLAAKVIETYLGPLTEFEIVAILPSAIDAYNYLSENKVDLIFLDINMPSLSGLDFLKSLKNPPLVIITTAYREYAIEGFDLDVIDYLVKPIPLPRFLHALDKVKSQLKTTDHPSFANSNKADLAAEQFVLLKVDKKIIKIELNAIYYIESLKDYIRVKTKIGDFITHQTLTAITNLLPHTNFIRIHRSYTIALNKVSALNGNAVEINNNLIPIGRNYISEVKETILKSGIKGS